MEMLQLRYFYESAKAESFSKTAKKYMVPVSSVSASVKRLEQELGVELFVRTGNRILLTEKGKQFLTVVSNTLQQLDMGVSAVTTAQEMGGTLHLLLRTCRQTITKKILAFHALYPTISFQLTFEDVPENYGNYDLVVSRPGAAFADYESFELSRRNIRIAAHATDPLCQRNVTLRQLKDRVFVTTSAKRGTFAIFKQACQRQGFTPRLFLECDDYSCWNMAMQSGECLGLTMGNQEHPSTPDVLYLNVTDFHEQIINNVYYKKEKCNSNVKLFVDFIKNSLV